MRVLFALYSYQHLVWSVFLIVAIFLRCVVVFLCDFILYFPNGQCLEFLHVLTTIPLFSLVKCLFRSISPMPVGDITLKVSSRLQLVSVGRLQKSCPGKESRKCLWGENELSFAYRC